MCDHVTSHDVVYLKPRHTPYVSVERRRYCNDCGVVSENGGRPVNYFAERLEDVQHMIQGRARRLGIRELTEAEKRIILLGFREDPIMCDIYGSTFDAQCDRFVDTVVEHRNVPRYMITSLLV